MTNNKKTSGMKTIFRFPALLALVTALVCGCEESVEPLHHTAPQVSFPVEDPTMRVTVGEEVEFQARIEAGDRLTCSWYVDGTLEASTPTFTYVFHKPGTFKVRFEARNGAGSVSREYEVTASDVLEMHLSVGDSTRIERLQMDNLRVMAIVTAGSDVRHEWSVDGCGFQPYVLGRRSLHDRLLRRKCQGRDRNASMDGEYSGFGIVAGRFRRLYRIDVLVAYG